MSDHESSLDVGMFLFVLALIGALFLLTGHWLGWWPDDSRSGATDPPAHYVDDGSPSTSDSARSDAGADVRGTEEDAGSTPDPDASAPPSLQEPILLHLPEPMGPDAGAWMEVERNVPESGAQKWPYPPRADDGLEIHDPEGTLLDPEGGVEPLPGEDRCECHDRAPANLPPYCFPREDRFPQS